MTSAISKTKRSLVLAKTGGRCHYCWCVLGIYWEIDHVFPVSRGGRHNIENLVPACEACNRIKGGRIIPDLDSTEDFLREVYS